VFPRVGTYDPAMLVQQAGASALLAHQGGWDEIGLVALPIALLVGLLAIANRRATRAQAERRTEPEDTEHRA
jgi:hypothetical protein